jgi:hypothetical protein
MDNDVELVGTSVSSGHQAVATTDRSDGFVNGDVDKDVDSSCIYRRITQY